MKKVVSILLCLLVLFGMASCGENNGIDTETTGSFEINHPADSSSAEQSDPEDSEPDNAESGGSAMVTRLNGILQKQYTFSQFVSIYPQYEITSQSTVAINVEIPEFENVIFVFAGEVEDDISNYTMASANAGGDVLLPEHYGKTFDQIKSEEPENVNCIPTDEIMQHLYQYEYIYIYRDDFYFFIRGYRHGDELRSDHIAMCLYDDTHQRP